MVCVILVGYDTKIDGGGIVYMTWARVKGNDIK